MLKTFTATVLMFLAVGLAIGQAPPVTAEQRLAAMLEAMGGSTAWSALSGVKVTATHYSTRFRLPYKNVIWNDFAAPRTRTEVTSAEINRTVVLDQKIGWRRNQTEIRLLTESEITEEQRWWESNPYRTIQRLAKSDSDLSVKLIEPDRLGVFRKDGTRLNWFRLNQANEPVAFGTWDAEDGAIFGPLVKSKYGIRHPRWVSRPDGRWRAEIIEFTPFRKKVDFETNQPN